MLRGLVCTIGALAVAALIPTTAAALPAARPPSSTALKASGLKVSWPLRQSETTVTPGQKLSVKLTAFSARAAVVRVGLVRVDPRGRAMRVISEKRARRGTLGFTVPARAGASYSLRLIVARKTYRSWLRTSRPAPVPSTPFPLGKPPAAPQCSTVTDYGSFSLRVDPPAAKAGATVQLRLTNVGSGCAYYGAGYGFGQRQPDGSLSQAGPLLAFPAIAFVAQPGSTSTQNVYVPTELTPGAYVIVKDTIPSAAATVPFTVLPSTEYAVPIG